MCGISGFILKKNASYNSDDAKNVISQMNSAIAHRGPDGNGVFIDEEQGVYFGHQRLAIIDKTGGGQPMHSSDERCVLTFNGEIYNYRELREILIKNGFNFISKSDTEVILNAYLFWGKDCVNKLEGMFAFAIWDKRYKTIFCARDRLGIKPFYYYHSKDSFVFCSEIKGLFKNPAVKKDLDSSSLVHYLRHAYTPAPHTIYKNIYKLAAGCTLTITPELTEPVIEQYWDIELSPDLILTPGLMKRKIEEWSNTLHEILSDTVKKQMVSDVPVGAFLSGGIDSSTIVGLMNQYAVDPISTQCIKFNESDFDESDNASQIARHFNTVHHETLFNNDIIDDIPKIIWHMDEPLADTSALPTWLLSKVSKRHSTVCLSGDGGDELFSGYDWYKELKKLERYKNNYLLGSGIVKHPVSLISSVFPSKYRGGTLLQNYNASLAESHYNLTKVFDNKVIKRLLSVDDSERVRFPENAIFESYAKYSDKGIDGIKLAQYVDTKNYLAEDILMKVDKMSMAHSLEVRVPLLDHKLVEFAFTIPSSANLSISKTKQLLVNTAKKVLPEDFIQKNKKGFTPPISLWLSDNKRFKEMASDILFNKSQVSGLFNDAEIKKLWNKNSRNSMNIDCTNQTWALLAFEIWNNQQ